MFNYPAPLGLFDAFYLILKESSEEEQINQSDFADVGPLEASEEAFENEGKQIILQVNCSQIVLEF
jgi:hypothetical protein